MNELKQKIFSLASEIARLSRGFGGENLNITP
jgi:hypothetical protein